MSYSKLHFLIEPHLLSWFLLKLKVIESLKFVKNKKCMSLVKIYSEKFVWKSLKSKKI